MTRNDFSSLVNKIVGQYIQSFDLYDSNPQLKVNPVTLTIQLVNGSEMQTDIEYSDEAIEEAAGAQTPEYEDAMDAQARRNPDFYAVKRLLKKDANGKATIDQAAIEEIANIYFK